MIRERITIINKAGLHARAAARLAETCSRFESEICIGGDKLVDGRSILSLMMLAAGKGTELNVEIEGPDEQEALQAINTLVENRFDEAE